jgi:hypothetical protein
MMQSKAVATVLQLLTLLTARAAVLQRSGAATLLPEASSGNVELKRVVCVSQGNTGTHSIFDVNGLRLPAVHYLNEFGWRKGSYFEHERCPGKDKLACLQSKQQPSLYPAHEAALDIYNELLQCTAKGKGCDASAFEWSERLVSALKSVGTTNLSVADTPYSSAPQQLAAKSFDSEGVVFVRLRRNPLVWAKQRIRLSGDDPVCTRKHGMWDLMARSPLDLVACANACAQSLGKASATLGECYAPIGHISPEILAAGFEVHEALLARLFRGRLLDLDLYKSAHPTSANAISSALRERAASGAFHDLHLAASDGSWRVERAAAPVFEGGFGLKAPSQKVLVHHIPKTAGASLVLALNQTGDMDDGLWPRYEQCLSVLRTPVNFVATMLRSPRSHVISQYTECRDDEWGKALTKGTAFPRSGEVTADLAKWVKHFNSTSWRRKGFDFGCYSPFNMQARALVCEQSGITPLSKGGRTDTLKNIDTENVVHHAFHHSDAVPPVHKALLNLEYQVESVGVMELFEESWCLLQYQLHQKLPSKGCRCGEYEDLVLPHELHGVAKASKVDVTDVDDQTIQHIDALTTQDAVVYDKAVSLLLQRLRSVELTTGEALLCKERVQANLRVGALSKLSAATRELISKIEPALGGAEKSPIDRDLNQQVGRGVDLYTNTWEWIRDYLNPKTTLGFDLMCTKRAMENGAKCTRGDGNWEATKVMSLANNLPPPAGAVVVTAGISKLNDDRAIHAFVWPAVELRAYAAGFDAVTTSSDEGEAVYPTRWFGKDARSPFKLDSEASDRLTALTIEPLWHRVAPHCYILRADGREDHSIAVPYPTSFHVASAAEMDAHMAWMRAVAKATPSSERTLALLFAGIHSDPGIDDGKEIRVALTQQCTSSHRCNVMEGNPSNEVVHGNLAGATFCLQPAGDTPSRSQVFECLIAGGVPVFFASCARPDLVFERMYAPFLPSYERHSFGAGDWAVLLDANKVLKEPKYMIKQLETIAADHGRLEKLRAAGAATIPRITYPVRGSQAALHGLGQHEPGLVTTLHEVLRDRGLDEVIPDNAPIAQPSKDGIRGGDGGGNGGAKEDEAPQLPSCRVKRLGGPQVTPRHQTVDTQQTDSALLVSHLHKLCKAGPKDAELAIIDPQIMWHASDTTCGCDWCTVPNRCQELKQTDAWQRGLRHVIVYSYWNRWLFERAFAGCLEDLHERHVLIATADTMFVTSAPVSKNASCVQILGPPQLPVVVPYLTSLKPKSMPSPVEFSKRSIQIQMHAAVKKGNRNPSGRLRAKLAKLSHHFENTDIVIEQDAEYGKIEHNTIQKSNEEIRANVHSMANSKLCLSPEGDTPTSRRFYDALSAGCVPVLFFDPTVLPYVGYDHTWNDIAIVLPRLNISVANMPMLVKRLQTELDDEESLQRKAALGHKVFKEWLDDHSWASANGLLTNVAQRLDEGWESAVQRTTAVPKLVRPDQLKGDAKGRARSEGGNRSRGRIIDWPDAHS